MTKLLRHLNSFAFVRDAEMNADETNLVIPMEGFKLHVHANGMVFLSVNHCRDCMVELHDDPTWDNVFWFMQRAKEGADEWFPDYDTDDEDAE